MKNKSTSGNKGEVTIWLRYLVLYALNPSPSTHDERVIGGDNGDHVNTLGLELIILD